MSQLGLGRVTFSHSQGQKTNFGLCRLPTTSTPRADIQEQTFSDAGGPIAIPLQTITHTVDLCSNIGRVGINNKLGGAVVGQVLIVAKTFNAKAPASSGAFSCRS
jgi:hypothetical protein